MGYSYIGKFVDIKNRRRIINADLSFLKSLNERSYDCELGDITPTGRAKNEDFPDVTSDYEYSFVGYYKSGIINNEDFWKYLHRYIRKDWNKTVDAYFVEEIDLDELSEKMEPYCVKPSINELAKFDEKASGVVILYAKKKTDLHGYWYKKSDFEAQKDKYEKKFFDAYDRLEKLRSLKDTKDWFEMSDNARENYWEDFNYAESDLNELRYEYEAIANIINIFEFLEDEGIEKINEFGEASYTWEYNDKREIELFIEVC